MTFASIPGKKTVVIVVIINPKEPTTMNKIILTVSETTVARKFLRLRFNDFDASVPSNPNSVLMNQFALTFFNSAFISPAPRIASIAAIFAAFRAGSHADKHTVVNEQMIESNTACQEKTKFNTIGVEFSGLSALATVRK